jgi:hypothetical protein
MAIDHVVVAVNDLTRQSRIWNSASPSPGGDHAHRGSHKALITFQDGSYIE